MSEISAGDMVQIVRPTACGYGGRIGMTFTVSGLIGPNIGRCRACGHTHMEDGNSALRIEGERAVAIPLWRLKKIDPLKEEELTEVGQEIEA